MTYFTECFSYMDPRLINQTRWEIDREDAREMINYLAAVGRHREAWVDCRKEIQLHFRERPAFLSMRPQIEREWRKALGELLALRRSIRECALRERRRNPGEAERLAAFNETFHGRAA